MQNEEVSYAKSVVNASYVSRRGSGTCSVRQLPPSRFQRDEASSLKVKQHLIQLAREEKDVARRTKLDRSASLDYGRLGSRIFEYKIDSNRMAEKAFDNSRGYPIESDVIRPLALKPLVLANSELSLSQALSSELFSSGSIPSNKEIDRLIEVIKEVRQRNSLADETSGNRVRFRRHSDVSDLRNSKRSIKDPPSRSLTRSKSNGSSEKLEKHNFGSSRSAFKSIPRCSSGKHLHKRQCSQETIPEEDGTEEDVPEITQKIEKLEIGKLESKPQRVYPVLDPPEDYMPAKPSIPKISKIDVPEKYQVSSGDSSPTQSEPSAPVTPPDNSLRTTPSPDNETNRAGQAKPTVNCKTYVKRRSSSSLGFSVRNPTSRNAQNNTHDSSGNNFNGPDDFVLQHSLMRKARHRHRMCSQPCVGSSPQEDDGVEKLPSPRYSPNTHPRARLPSTLAICSGNHPPVSYLNYIRRSKSLQVNHIALHEFRNLQRTHDNRLKYSDQEDLTLVTDRDTISSEPSASIPSRPSLDLLPERGDGVEAIRNTSSDIPVGQPAYRENQRPHSHKTEVVEALIHSRPLQKTDSTVPQEQQDHPLRSPDLSSARRARQRRHHSLDGTGAGPAFRDLNEVKDLFKRVGRKYLSDHCVLPCAFPEIEKRNSLSFVFDGNKELQEKVRTFFQQTNKSYCMRLIKQRFASNPLDCTPDGSVVGDLEQGVRPLSEYADVINAHITSKSSSDLNESLQAYLQKSETFVSNKCNNFNEKDKMTKADKMTKDNFLATLTASTSLLEIVPKPHAPKVPAIPIPEIIAPAPAIAIIAPVTAPPIATSALPIRTILSSNNSECSECPFKNNSSKSSRDSGYGDSTSASNEGLNPPKRRNRSASLTILSKLKPLFGLRKRDLVPDEGNPFNKIFEDQPISEFAKSVDNFIARRSSLPLPEPVAARVPSATDYEDIPVFDSPSDNLSPAPSSSALDSQQVLNGFDSILNSELQVTSLMTSLLECEAVTEQVSDEEDDDFRVSPLPEDLEEDDEDDEVFYLMRNSLEDVVTNHPTNSANPTNDKFSLQDIQEILDSFDVIQQTAPTSDKEYHKVHNMLQSKLTIALGSIYHTLSNATVPPNSTQYFAKNTLEDTLDYLDERLDVEEDNANILELVGLLETFEDFIDLHDEIISRTYYENETLPEMKDVRSVGGNDNTSNTNHSIYRMVGLHKNKGEPLGITLKKEDDRVVVHRILAGGMIDRQRLLHIGDVIISINNQDVQPKPELIQHMLKDEEGDIHLKIIPSYREQAPACQVFVKAHFNYDPKSDNLIPCKEAGLKFNEGDILQIVNQDDPNWWQAKMEGGEGQAGLIPGLILQEQRMASKNNTNNEKTSSIGCGGANRRKKKNKKMNYSANKNSDFDQHELNLYEEVAKMPPFDRKTLVLIGAQGVGRRSLISKLVLNEPDKFGNTMPHTSRPIRAGEKDGCGYWFTTREKMDEDIANHKYLEYGEYEKHLYGTKLDSIRQVMRSGKMCLLDVNPQSLKVLKTSEFVPYIVFIEAPPFETLVQMHKESARDNPNKAFSENDLKKSIEESKRLKRQYSHYFDVIIQNNNMDETYSKLYECISKLSTSPQWVPVNWFY